MSSLIRRKKPTNYPENRCLLVTVVAMACCLAACIVIAFHSHNLLGFDLAMTGDSSRLFITNKLDKFEQDLNSLMMELSPQDKENKIVVEEDDRVAKGKMNGKFVEGSQRGEIEDVIEKGIVEKLPYHELSCPNGDLLTFWKRCTLQDMEHVSPFETVGPANKYVTFEPGIIRIHINRFDNLDFHTK